MDKIILLISMDAKNEVLHIDCSVEDEQGAESFTISIEGMKRSVENLKDIKQAIVELEQLRITRTIVKLLKELHTHVK